MWWSDYLSKYQASFQSKGFVYLTVESLSKTSWHQSLLVFCCCCRFILFVLVFFGGARGSGFFCLFVAAASVFCFARNKQAIPGGIFQKKTKRKRRIQIDPLDFSLHPTEWEVTNERGREAQSVPIRASVWNKAFHPGQCTFLVGPLCHGFHQRMQQIHQYQRKRKLHFCSRGKEEGRNGLGCFLVQCCAHSRTQ